MTQIWIDGPLPGINQLIDDAKSGRGKFNAYSRTKKKWTGHLARIFRGEGVKPLRRVDLRCEWHDTKSQRRDPDNVAGGGTKMILDALVLAGVIKNDTFRYVKSISHTFIKQDNKCGVLVDIREAG